MLRLLCPLLLALCCCLGACLPQLSPSPAPPAPRDDASAAEAWLRTLEGKTPLEQARLAEIAWNDVVRPQALRDRAASIVATRPSSQSLAAQQTLSRAYAQAAPARRAALERTLMADLRTTDDATLRLLGASVPRNQEKTFPWSLILWQAASKQLVSNSAAVLERLADPALYADPTLVGLAAPVAGSTGVSLPGGVSCRVALLLPLSGTFGAVGNQVAAGAAVAASQLEATGSRVDVIIVDTEQPGWTSRVAALPADCVVVGGPLRADALISLRSSPLPGRALFAFLPALPNPQEEGTALWRFFTSPQDQIDAVLDFAMGELGVNAFGVLAPDDAYGGRMADLFRQTAARRGAPVSSATYPVKDIPAWTDISGKFLQATTPERGKVPEARAPFGAIFLPDSWKNMDMLVSTLHYHGGHQKIMLGTALWEQGLASTRGFNPVTFGLTVFPGAWNPQAPGAAALIEGMAGRPQPAGDWAALGYDFVRMAAALGLASAPSAQQMNAKLAALRLDWAGAPMAWDSQGKAHRRLYLFQPSRAGSVPLDHAAFARYRSSGGALPNVDASDAANAPANPAGLTDELDKLVNSVVGAPQASQASQVPPAQQILSPNAPAGRPAAAAPPPAVPVAPAPAL